MIAREAMGDDVGAERSRRVDAGAGIVDAYIGRKFLALQSFLTDRNTCKRGEKKKKRHTAEMTDEEREADSDGSQEGGLVLDGGQHDDCQHQLCCGEHFNEEPPRDGTVSSKSDVDRHRSR